MKNTALYGNNIWTPMFKEKGTIGECQKACMYNADCKFWSYRKQDKKCAIKTSKGNAMEGNDGQWESGASDCEPIELVFTVETPKPKTRMEITVL